MELYSMGGSMKLCLMGGLLDVPSKFQLSHHFVDIHFLLLCVSH